MPDFYQTNFKRYYSETFLIDPTDFLGPLLKYLPAGASVLDIGCGSGRDLLWLRNNGFQAKGFERATNLAELARQSSGCPVIEGDFSDYDFSLFNVDALILVGALVHVNHNNLASTFANICKALKLGGFILITLKEGKGVRQHEDGRLFYLWNEPCLRQIFNEIRLSVIDFSRQISKIRNDDVWLGYVLRSDNSKI
jgi:SAM-dependent methyltransferase